VIGQVFQKGRRFLGATAHFGAASSRYYRTTFHATFPGLRGEVVVHHAVEQQVLKRYPGLITESELHSIENLRGIAKELNPDLHLRKIRELWDDFYETVPHPSKQELLDFATRIDDEFGQLWIPPWRR
jgi:hypothetical protein